MTRLCVLGALHWDVLVQAPNLPRRDETVRGSAVAYDFGGKGGNQAVAAQRNGANTYFVGRLGQDGFGENLLRVLQGFIVYHYAIVEGKKKSYYTAVAGEYKNDHISMDP